MLWPRLVGSEMAAIKITNSKAELHCYCNSQESATSKARRDSASRRNLVFIDADGQRSHGYTGSRRHRRRSGDRRRTSSTGSRTGPTYVPPFRPATIAVAAGHHAQQWEFAV